jgi:hypothetical protein
MSILQFKPNRPLSAEVVSEMIDELAMGWAEVEGYGTPVEKIAGMFRAIVSQCIGCSADEAGVVSLKAIAHCPNETCSLQAYGPSVFQAVEARLEWETEQTGNCEGN